MRILFFHRWVGVHAGGTETHVKELAFRLAQRNHEVHVLTAEGKELKGAGLAKVWRVSKSPFESDFSYEDGRVYIYTLIYLMKSFLKLLELKLEGIEFDVVSVHFTTEAFLMRFLRKIFRWPYIFILEGYTDAEANTARYADLQIAISKDIIDKCHAKFGYRPLFIPVGVDLAKYNEAYGHDIRKKFCSDDEKLVLTLCRLDPRKDIPTLVSAAKIVREKDPAIRFIIVGDGIDRGRIEAKIIELNLQGNVKIVRDMPASPNYYKASDVFVLPSLYEGFGIVFLEAMASGIPIVSTTAKAIPEAVGDAGILVPPKQPELLAEAILQVIHDDRLKKELVSKGFRRVKRYSWNDLIVEYEKAYKSVLKS